MIHIVALMCALLLGWLRAAEAAALTPHEIAATSACLFDASKALCLTHDWNADGALSAADLAGYLRFIPVAPGAIRVTDGDLAVVMRSEAALLRVDKATARVTLGTASADGLTIAGAPTLKIGGANVPLSHLHAVQLLPRGVSLTADAGATTVQWTIEFVTARAIRTRLHPASSAGITRVLGAVQASAGERFYGLAERIVDNRTASEIIPQAVGGLDRRGERVTMTLTPTMSLYTPFFHSSRGYGVFVEGTMTGVYDMAKTGSNTVSMDFEFNPRTAEHSVVYFVGDYDTLLDEYTALTGRPFLPPRWGFRHLRWRDEHRVADPAQLDGVDMNADFVDDVTMYEALHIPVGNYEFDRPWTDGVPPAPPAQPGFSSFAFDPVRFPNSDRMMAALKNRGYHVLIFIAPWALGDNAADAEQFGYYAPRSHSLIDYTNPAAAAWWTQHIQSLIGLGIDGLKLDRSEFDPNETGDIAPTLATDVFFDGRNGRELINGYTLEYARVHYDAYDDPAHGIPGNFFHYLRAGYAGSQQYGIFWGGDSPATTIFGLGQPTDLGLRAAILQLARVAFLAFPIWGSDTGGYYEFGDRDVFARWLEFSALCPLMEIGGGNPGGRSQAPWDMPTDPTYDPEMIDIYRFSVTLHHELVPLIYSLAIEAHDSGRPLARPLVFDFPEDPAVGDLWDEFLLGHDLLFAPLWHIGDRSRQVYLPQGTWIDYWQPSHRFTGPISITADAPLARIPLYVRAGGILPLEVNSDVTNNGSHALSDGRLTLDAYPLAASTLTLHEDQGDSTFALGEAACGDGSCVQLDLNGTPRGYVVRLLLDAASGVTLDGAALTPVDTFAALETAASGWFFDAAVGRLWVKFATTTPTARVVVTR